MGAIGAPVIGFANLDQQGVAGSEWYYDAWLRATDEWPDNRLPPGQPEPLPESWKVYLPSPGGRDLVLHLNAALQHLTEQRLQEAVQYYGAESGTIIVMDPRTGGILALANVPSFDPNRYAQSPAELWGNSAVRDTYEPGSVFKLVTYAAAIDSGKVTPETMFEDSGSLAIAGQTIQNAEEQAYGSVTAREALAKSINVVAAQICLDMGAEVFYRYVRQFGFGKPTEVDLNYESEGIVKGLGNKYWSQYDQAANSFGQGISVTALQMLNAVAAIANGGEVLQPQAVRALVLNGQVYEIPPRVMRRAITAETARTMAQLMVYNVESSSNPSPVPGFRVAGKTGTAEIPTETGYTSDETITSFAAFLPAADPKLVVLVKLVKPTRSSWAERVVVPVFAQVAQDAIQVLGIQPDDRNP
jgi:cell division protein FtsI/penicillin-binding protein 2